MKLMTNDVKARLPALYSQESKQPGEIEVLFKAFNPMGTGTWYITEGDVVELGDGTMDYMMFGLCCIHDAELGYVMLSELESYRGRFQLPIERDRSYRGTLADAMRREGIEA